MNAVLRLNLFVSCVFVIALGITVYAMLQQASKDINREVLSSVSFTHQLLTSATHDDELLADLLTGGVRHVRVDLISSDELISKGPGSDTPVERDSEVPLWFYGLIPGVEHLEDKQYFRYLSNGDVLRLQANSSDEVEEVWESIQNIVLLFLLSGLLSNCAIYVGVRLGLRPVAHFLEAIESIKQGRYEARLQKYKTKEINELSWHFNMMAQELELAEQSNKNLTRQLMQVQEQERAHLARELHDDIGQFLTGIQAQAYLVGQSIDKPDVVKPVTQQIVANCEAVQNSFRQLIKDLHPVILEELGLQEAIGHLVDNWRQQHDISAQLEIENPLPNFNDNSSTHIYRIVQESLNNIAKHAHAQQVLINIGVDHGQLILSLSDDGVGLSGSSQGLGLRSMRERAACLGGEFKVSSPGKGVVVTVTVPLSGVTV